jgi:N-acetyl-gamma-glutamyl-phosphate reductase
LRHYTGLERKPLFAPAVGSWRQGQLVQIPLHLSNLPQHPTAGDMHAVLSTHYEGRHFVRVMPFVSDQPPAAEVLAPEALAGTNIMELFVFENRAEGHALLVARTDNLGKGASGAAAQNQDIMFGRESGRSYELEPES